MGQEGGASGISASRTWSRSPVARKVRAGGTRSTTNSLDWGDNLWRDAGFRAVPNCIVRNPPIIAPGVVLMPSFVNMGAYVDSGTMVDTWATVGSCAQIGKNVHLSGGVGIGGVLEPMQAGPTIIEDDCFIGARSEVVEGASSRRLGSWHGRVHRQIHQDRRPRNRRTSATVKFRQARWSSPAPCRPKTA